MSRYVTVNTDVDVDVYLGDFATKDLVEELRDRGYTSDGTVNQCLLEKIWLKRREGKNYQSELDEYIYEVLGKVV